MPIVVKERTRAAAVVLPVVRVSRILRVLAGCLALLLCILHVLLWLQQQKQQQPHSARVVVVNKRYQGPSSHHSGATTLDSSFSPSDHHHPNNDGLQQQQSSSTSKTAGQEHNQQEIIAKALLVKHRNNTKSLSGSNLDKNAATASATKTTTTTQASSLIARATKAAEYLRRSQQQQQQGGYYFPDPAQGGGSSTAGDAKKKEETILLSAAWGDNEHNDFFDPSSNTSVFYNAYISPTDPSTAITIIRKQLQLMMQTSSSSSRRSDAWPATVNNSYSVYYNIIGHDLYKNNDTITKNATTTTLCPSGMDCRFMRYYPSALEDATLTGLHEYCQRYPEHDVLYLHDKGSNHGTPKNHKKRIQMTTELMSAPPCRDDGDETSSSSSARRRRRRQRHYLQCNVCTVQFNHLPHWHATNNMWSASCQHVRKLISPHEFASRRYGTMNAMLAIPALLAVQSGNANATTNTTATNKSSTTTTSDDLRTDLLCLYEHFRPEERETRSITEWMDRFGHLDRLKLGRYLWENWVWMHPDTQPCDIIIREEEEEEEEEDHDNNNNNARRSRRFFLQRAPRKGFHRLVHHAKADSGMSELYRMRGLLVQLYYLYRAVPPQDSWFWSYYRRAVDASPICEHRINE